jgi:cob(I)alamin adenosyltransferase
MKIYTRTGDRGTTSLLGGNIVPKDHPRIEAYGTLDELNAWVGLIRDLSDDAETREVLLRIQDRIMVGSALLASERKENESLIPDLHEEDILLLEDKIDEMDKSLEPLKNFILPGGHTSISFCHLARTTCRRTERLSIRFMDDSHQVAMLVKYLNRLSDYLFMLARKIAWDLNIEEISWQPE